jgi:serine/threonine protein kinase
MYRKSRKTRRGKRKAPKTNVSVFLPRNGREIVKIHETKNIYELKNDPEILVKIMNGGITPQIQNEIDLQKYAHALGLSPNIIEYYEEGGKTYILMEKVKGISLADEFGDNPDVIPDDVWDQIRDILLKLYIHGIQYKDITAYNFMLQEDGSIKIIDFGHAIKIPVDEFLTEFLEGTNGWNPEFA